MGSNVARTRDSLEVTSGAEKKREEGCNPSSRRQSGPGLDVTLLEVASVEDPDVLKCIREIHAGEEAVDAMNIAPLPSRRHGWGDVIDLLAMPAASDFIRPTPLCRKLRVHPTPTTKYASSLTLILPDCPAAGFAHPDPPKRVERDAQITTPPSHSISP